MSSSYNLECELQRMSEKLAAESQALHEAAEVLKRIRHAIGQKAEIEDLKTRVKDWLK